ncbi:MAG: hypothetical protein ACD_15C00151G0016 [uncultured bacterium]|nr:MAG: hypothetical protein ACD_15C00151G0016 [uncultured bacterium]
MDTGKKQSLFVASGIVAWIALLLALIAIFLAIAAFNRSGSDLDKILTQKTEEYKNEAEKIAIKTEARAELIALRGKIEGAQAGEGVVNQVANTRRNIQESYRNTSADLKQEASEIDRELELVERDVRTNTAQGLQKLENLIDRVGRDIRTDDKK